MFAIPMDLFPKEPRYAYGVSKEKLDEFMTLCVRFKLTEMHFQKSGVRSSWQNDEVLWLIEVPMPNDMRVGFNFMATDEGIATIFDLNQKGENE